MRVILVKPPGKLSLWNAPVCDLGFGYLAPWKKKNAENFLFEDEKS